MRSPSSVSSTASGTGPFSSRQRSRLTSRSPMSRSSRGDELESDLGEVCAADVRLGIWGPERSELLADRAKVA